VKQEYTMDNYVKKHFELYESILRGDV
jgi:hypothetical protein